MIAFTLLQEDRIGGEEHIHMIRMGCLCGHWGSPGGSKGVSLGVGVGSWMAVLGGHKVACCLEGFSETCRQLF